MKDINMSRHRLLEKGVAILLTLGIVAVANAEDPPVNLPRVVVVGSSDGGQIICYGYDCADALASLMPAIPPLATEMDAISDQGSTYDREEFCEALEAKEPSGCDLSDPPSTADTDPAWQPNGCGTSGFVNTLMQIGIMALVPDDFAGNYNAPYSGISFLAACNAHDQCYSMAFDKAFCDERFGDNMEAACGAVTDSAGYSVCAGLAGMYKGAVASTTFGADAYASSFSDHTCAVWAKDMKANGCDE